MTHYTALSIKALQHLGKVGDQRQLQIVRSLIKKPLEPLRKARVQWRNAQLMDAACVFPANFSARGVISKQFVFTFCVTRGNELFFLFPGGNQLAAIECRDTALTSTRHANFTDKEVA